MNVLEVSRLTVSYRRGGVWVPVVREVSLQVGPHEAYGLVGESGCGKTTLALALLRALPANGRIEGGSIRVEREEVLALDAEGLRRLRGGRVAMVYQDASSALNPAMRVGDQVAEVYRYQLGLAPREAWRRAREMLAQVAIPDPDTAMRRYPHELSGGQQQRVVIAMALAPRPRLVILDEPTAGLDATLEAEILDLLEVLRAQFQTSFLLITHNLGLVARLCDRVGILYAGRLLEEGPARSLLKDPRNPYTLGLFRSVPRLGRTRRSAPLVAIPGSLPPPGAVPPGCAFAPRCPIAQAVCTREEPAFHTVAHGHRTRCHFPEEVPRIPEVEGDAGTPGEIGPPFVGVEGLRKTYRRVVAADDVTLDIRAGEVLGLVGESGSGKTTVARCVAGLLEPEGGRLVVSGARVPWRVERRDRALLRQLQMVFQNPDATLNPRWSVRGILRRAVERLGGLRGKAREERVEELARAVRLDPAFLDVRAAQLSGGQRQRVAIARAFAGYPRLVICDEPVSALDVSVQAAVLNLLAELQAREGVAYLFISHDLGVVRYVSDRIAVMYLGRIVEVGPAEAVFQPPHHPYTETLLDAASALWGQRTVSLRASGPAPDPARLPGGCAFHPRCPRKLGPVCEQVPPPWMDAGNGHRYRCHIPSGELALLQRAHARAEPKEENPGPTA